MLEQAIGIAQQILDFCSGTWYPHYQPDYSFAHLVLGDYNLGNSSIMHCINARADYEKYYLEQYRHPGLSYEYAITVGYIELTYQFLLYLLGIPEDVRELASEILWGDIELPDDIWLP